MVEEARYCVTALTAAAPEPTGKKEECYMYVSEEHLRKSDNHQRVNISSLNGGFDHEPSRVLFKT